MFCDRYGRDYYSFILWRMRQENQYLRLGQAFVIYFTKAPYTNSRLFAERDVDAAHEEILRLLNDWQIPINPHDETYTTPSEEHHAQD